MVWDKSYETGNVEVDNEHKQLFTLVQRVIDAAFTNREEKIETTMNFLADYTVKHFAHEERLMDESSYPKTDEHKAQHKNFLNDVGEMWKRIKVENDTLKSSLDINRVVVDWLIEHVLGSDKMLADHYRKWAEAK